MERFPDEPPHFNTTFCLSTRDNHLYQVTNTTYVKYPPCSSKRLQGVKRFKIRGQAIQPSQEIIDSLISVDVAHYKTYTRFLCTSSINKHGAQPPQHKIRSLAKMLQNLPLSLQCLWSEIIFPADNGNQLINYLIHHNLPITGIMHL